MNLLYVLINALLYIVLLMWYWKKHKSLDAGFLLIFVWAFVAVMCTFNYLTTPKEWVFSLWPFLYLFVAFLIYTNIFVFHKKSGIDITGIVNYKNNKLDFLCYLYIACSFIYLIIIGFDPSVLSVSGIEANAVDAYNEAQVGNEGPVYSNQIEHFVMLYYSYFQIVALIAMFSYLCQNRLRLAYLLAFCIFFPYTIYALSRGSRGLLIEQVVFAAIGYIIFRKHIPSKIRKNLLKVTAIAAGFLALFLFAISLARFGDSDDGVGGSIFTYLGHSMLCFNYGICDSLENTFMGLRTFKNTLLKLGVMIPEKWNCDLVLGTHIGTSFSTFIGMLCVDFGFVGVILFGIVFSLIIRKMCGLTSGFTYASLSFYIFYLHRMIMGVFVNGPGADFAYYMNIIVYVFLLIFFRERKPNKQNVKAVYGQ